MNAFGAAGNGQVIMSGGTAGWLQTWGNGHLTFSGGVINSTLAAFDSSSITIIGSNFAVDGSPVDYGKYIASDFVGGEGVLTGILNNGALLNNSFYISTGASITLVPEPTTILLFGFGLTMAARKQRTVI